ncbi:MAG: CBS domain-containing protein [Deltaproteobacteria bacterium]|nr:CBS domain-containing protein [Deltaproteobacteria bacterium]
MSLNATRIGVGSDMQRAAEIVSLTGASDLMVVDDANHFVGVLSEGDLIRATLPRFDEIMTNSGSLNEALEIFVDKGKTLARQSIDDLIIHSPVVMRPDDKILKAASIMISKQIRRLPVVDVNGKLVGTVSRADVCRAVLSGA